MNRDVNPTARSVALLTLNGVFKDGKYSNIALDGILNRAKLSDSDRGLATILVYGVIERKLTLDYIIEKLAGRPLEKIDGDALLLVELGIYQLRYLDRVPNYAAVFETVELAPRKIRGFVNAIMREYLRFGEKTTFPDVKSQPLEYLSAAYSVPIPLCKLFSDVFGFERTERIFTASIDSGTHFLRVNTLKTTAEELKSALADCDIPCEFGFLPTTLNTKSGNSAKTGQFSSGDFIIQDLASQICVNAVGAKPGDTVIDACACPGSKSFGMAIDMNNSGRIISCDLHENKLSLIKSGAERLGISIVETRAADGRVNIPEWNGTADCVLCDVPCSGFGVIAKKPEIRYKNISESARLPIIQYAILENCAKYVKAGGTLVYSTCTILPAENALNVEKFLQSHGEFSLCPFDYGSKHSDGMLGLMPDTDGTDGFFIAKMIRTR